MTAEFQVPSPLVPTRENYFVRYCKQHSDGSWAVVDVSLDSLRPNPISRTRRRPSGCLIQELPNGYSKVYIIRSYAGVKLSIYEVKVQNLKFREVMGLLLDDDFLCLYVERLHG